MKAFRYTLEAVRTVRQRQERDALENYARALLIRRRALDVLEEVDESIGRDYAQMRRLLAGRCTAAQAAQAQAYHRSLETKRDGCLATLGRAERGVNAACKAMLAARQHREMVDVFRQKQHAVYQRKEFREEQKILDEFAIRRVTALNSVHSQSDHD
jgi:flagellar export protein FliJ